MLIGLWSVDAVCGAQEFMVGLSFADDGEADKFHSHVIESLHRRHTAPAPPLPTMFAPKTSSASTTPVTGTCTP